MISEVVKIKIKIKNEDLLFKEKTDIIIGNLKALIEHLEQTNGNVQQLKGNDTDSSIEYVHLKQN